MRPPALKAGDTIGIAASSSPFDREAFEEGVATLKTLGFEVYFRPDIFEKKIYLAGSDERRASELTELFENPKIKAILFARGGYGMLRVLPLLKKFPDKPKIVLGYSDLTPLLNHLVDLGWTTFYGPVVAKDLASTGNPDTRQHLLNALTKKIPLGPFSFEDTMVIRGGNTEGVLVGGCLSLVVAGIGTPYEINTKDRILFLEDTNEKPYEVDRMLTQLKLAGKLDRVRGILFGNFVNANQPDHYSETIKDVLPNLDCPILFNFPAGHGPLKVTLPLGIRVHMDTDSKKLEYLEPALA